MTSSETSIDFMLPTTPGSMVTFTGWADTAKTERFLYVATLLVGSIENGTTHDLVWGDSYVDGYIAGVFTEKEILAGHPTVIFEAKANLDGLPLAGEEVENNYGEVVTYLDMDDPAESPLRLTVTYTPGNIDQESGELSEAAWVNSYGGYIAWDNLLNSSPLVYAKGSKL